MNEYEFVLKFRLPNAEEDAANYLPVLEKAGCDDALIGIGQAGHIILDFIREADNAKDALLSAIDNVQSVIKGAVLIEASPDYVGVSDVADMLNISRQAVAKIMKEHWSAYPSPAHSGKFSVWYLSEVANFFEQYTMRKFTKSLFDIATVNRAVNTYSQVQMMMCKEQVHGRDTNDNCPQDIKEFLKDAHLHLKDNHAH